ncbi:hypothetical protein AK830_g5172 [Neonectria ditissima]|uniref:F-box domain-containing protein n=1 Tax=Neonectria ditissima TaxID=78410 RepID=A0A0P7BLE2_9HYPO|nr:hypothetical protein AK830_g5172 [Neonectria ditissima]
MLERMPPELLYAVIDELPPSALQALSRVSIALHSAVEARLWKSVVIRPQDERKLSRIPLAGFPESAIRQASHLDFRATFDIVICGRCPHDMYHHDTRNDEGMTVSEAEEEDAAGAEETCLALVPRRFETSGRTNIHFSRLSRRAEYLITQFPANQLNSFSWNMGTCIPSNILGTYGILSLKQPLLQSLELTTSMNTRCRYGRSNVDLSSFRHLKSLSWRAPAVHHLNVISVAIRNNSQHLHKLELDFIDWKYYQDEIEGTGPFRMNIFHIIDYFACILLDILSLDEAIPQLFPVIQVLSLSHMYLAKEIAHAINFETLRSLTLRQCPGLAEFIREAYSNNSIRLKTLEIYDTETFMETDTRFLGKLLFAFDGLEELFLCLEDDISRCRIWEYVKHHQATLKKFVYHCRDIQQIPLGPGHSGEWGVRDVIFEVLDGMDQDHSQHPLLPLDLECIGIGWHPWYLEQLLQPWINKVSLRLLHLRQCSRDLKDVPSLVFKAEDSVGMVAMDTIPCDRDHTHTAADETGTQNTHELRDEFRRAVEWAFGPDGVASLETIAYGDFAYDSREGKSLMLCRSADQPSGFQILSKDCCQWQEVLGKYRNVLEACPIEQFLECD